MKRKGFSFILNSAVADAPALKGSFETLARTIEKPRVRRDYLEGREHLVVPMIMLTEGVHEGSGGSLYYPESELKKTPQVWNHKPIVVYHPTMNGVGISACDPVILNSRKVGVILNTHYKAGRLRAEAWLEASRLEDVDSRVLDALSNNKVTEVSTGLYTDNEDAPGVWNGEEYDAVARNYRPDHLAILPDQKGACSVADGAGLLRLNADRSHEETREFLTAKLQKGKPEAWVIDVWDDFLIYAEAGKLYRQSYAIMDNEVTFAGVASEVMRKTIYEPVAQVTGNSKTGPAESAVQNHGSSEMDKEKIVEELIKNSQWTEADREFLMGLDEKRLALVANGVTEAAPKEEPVDNGEKKQDVKEVTPPAAPVTVESYIANAPREIQDVLRNGLKVHEDKKRALVAAIIANEKNSFSEAFLMGKSVDELEGLSALCAAPAPTGNAAPVPMFNGKGGSATPAPVTVEPLPVPQMTFDK